MADADDIACTESCIFGDYRGLVYIDQSTSLTCGDSGRRYPHKCYEESHSKTCCQTCVDIRRNDKPGPFVCLSVCPSVCPSVCLSLSVHVSAYQLLKCSQEVDVLLFNFLHDIYPTRYQTIYSWDGKAKRRQFLSNFWQS